MQRPAAASTPDEASAPVAASSVHVATGRPRRGRVVFQRVAAASFSVGVMTIVGMLAVGTTTPAPPSPPGRPPHLRHLRAVSIVVQDRR